MTLWLQAGGPRRGGAGRGGADAMRITPAQRHLEVQGGRRLRDADFG